MLPPQPGPAGPVPGHPDVPAVAGRPAVHGLVLGPPADQGDRPAVGAVPEAGRAVPGRRVVPGAGRGARPGALPGRVAVTGTAGRAALGRVLAGAVLAWALGRVRRAAPGEQHGGRGRGRQQPAAPAARAAGMPGPRAGAAGPSAQAGQGRPGSLRQRRVSGRGRVIGGPSGTLRAWWPGGAGGGGGAGAIRAKRDFQAVTGRFLTRYPRFADGRARVGRNPRRGRKAVSRGRCRLVSLLRRRQPSPGWAAGGYGRDDHCRHGPPRRNRHGPSGQVPAG